MPELLSKTELSARIARTATQITNLHAVGLPVVRNGRKVYYDWKVVGPWWEKYLRDLGAKASKPDAEQEVRIRKLTAEARVAELDLAEQEGSLIPIAFAKSELEEVLGRVRAKLLAGPGKYSGRMLGLKSQIDAQLALETMVSDVLRELMTTGEEPTNGGNGHGAGAGGVEKGARRGRPKGARAASTPHR